MITLFNRVTLAVTFSMEQQSRICDALAAAHVDYRVHVSSRGSASSSTSRARGSFGQNAAYAYEYTIYINKKDAGIAGKALHDSQIRLGV